MVGKKENFSLFEDETTVDISWSTWTTKRRNHLLCKLTDYASMHIAILQDNYLRDTMKYMKLLEN